MDPVRFKEAYERLQTLDELYTYKVRNRGSGSRASLEQVEDHLRDVSHYAIELKDILEELFLAIAGKPGGTPEAG